MMINTDSIKFYKSMLPLITLWVAIVSHCYSYSFCPFPDERCLCYNQISLCRCSQITADATLNLTAGYQSHLVLVGGMGCQPCSPECLKCSVTTSG